jgi:hypothetical protein
LWDNSTALIDIPISKQLYEFVIPPHKMAIFVLEIKRVFLLAGAEGSLGSAVLFATALWRC